MPKYDPDKGDYQILYINMSDYQFGIYESARVQERKLEQQNRKRRKKSVTGGDLYDDAVSTYRIFSRAFCNFVFQEKLAVQCQLKYLMMISVNYQKQVIYEMKQIKQYKHLLIKHLNKICHKPL